MFRAGRFRRPCCRHASVGARTVHRTMLSGSAASTVTTLERSAPTPSRSILSRVRPQPRRNEGRGIEPAFQLPGGSPAIWLEPAAGMPATRVASSPEPALHWDTARRGAGPPCIYRNSHAHKKGAHLSLIRPFHQKPLHRVGLGILKRLPVLHHPLGPLPPLLEPARDVILVQCPQEIHHAVGRERSSRGWLHLWSDANVLDGYLGCQPGDGVPFQIPR